MTIEIRDLDKYDSSYKLLMMKCPYCDGEVKGVPNSFINLVDGSFELLKECLSCKKKFKFKQGHDPKIDKIILESWEVKNG